jgi:hypothetical protein
MNKEYIYSYNTNPKIKLEKASNKKASNKVNPKIQKENKVNPKIKKASNKKASNKKASNKKASNKKLENNSHIKILLDSFYKNYIFYFTLLFCLYKFKQHSNYSYIGYIGLIISFLCITFFGYATHYTAHHINFVDFCKSSNNILTNNTYTSFIINSVAKICDFHDKIHHDTSINKHVINIIYEFLNNILMQGIGFILIIKLLNMIDTRVIILWAMFYATVHNINYLFIKPTVHRDHHLNKHTNYGIDFYDILLNSKNNWNDIEIYNHAAINLLIITYCIIYFL